MLNIKDYEVWFVTGSQHLYGAEPLRQIAENSKKITEYLSDRLPVKVVYKPVMTDTASIKELVLEANTNKSCIGLITWMHTFSPAKMWINGLKLLQKPMAHLHTQFNRDIPWSEIDMDFMNLNQAAHGDREFGFMVSRLRMNRKVIVGHWQDEEVVEKLSNWCRVAAAWQDSQGAKIARFGDNMREVAVTEGDKVEAEIKFGYSVNGYGIGNLVSYVEEVTDGDIDNLVKEYKEEYNIVPELLEDGSMYQSLREGARIELGLRAFLEEGNFKGFTTNFETLHGMKQLPGLAVQRLMADGYGFGAEGDWKTAALVRAMKVMAGGKETSFMEFYTYHLEPGNQKTLGSHMLEVCPSIAEEKPSLEIHPLSIGGKADPVRLVFNTAPGKAINASIVDMGNRFRLIVNEIEVVRPDEDLPKLPVARAVWKPLPDFKTAIAAWILAGGAHHTGFSKVVTTEMMEDFAEMADIEFLAIDENTDLRELKKEIRWNEVYYKLR
ncbi:MAG: L-arabinose isomerase [Halanaerobiales bacterium]|jgi:L-arabinose isomerase|nr:L-arabinose isomerase [Halanaerobiales bacterium]HPZ62096.1 L-arabinose isomerase [Halanaerobiales bacterium]HQD03407.1 L-arabinose isomerase [Halanaerobiales bacterium]